MKIALQNFFLKKAPMTIFLVIAGCASYPDWISSSGPNRKQVELMEESALSIIRVININDDVARRVSESSKQQFFSQKFTNSITAANSVGPGDVLEVSIWEAPPAALFGSSVIDPRAGVNSTRASVMPEQMISVDGYINVPFAGSIPVAGKSTKQIEIDIAKRLAGKANQPQVLVRIIRNVSANVTVVGEVGNSIRMPLTANGEKLLDAIAAAGGTRQPVNKITVQITRGGSVLQMPLEKVIQFPKENIPLAPGDVVTVSFQPLSYVVLGATGKNEEINFEAQGISMSQAIARAGGLQDARADARGVFLFRFEEPLALAEELRAGPVTPDGRVPVIYRIDMKNPSTFLVAQNFPIRNKDVLYVSNAPSAEFQKFLNILTSSIFSVNNLVNLSR